MYFFRKKTSFLCLMILFTMMFQTFYMTNSQESFSGGSVNLALHKNVTVSRETKGKDHKKVTDGNKAVSKTGDTWNVKSGDSITLDLGQSEMIQKVTVFEYGAEQKLFGYKLEVSEDNAAWTLVSESTKSADGQEPAVCPIDTGIKTNSNHGMGSIEFSAVSARYIKLTIKSAVSKTNIGYVEEIEVYGDKTESNDNKPVTPDVKTDPPIEEDDTISVVIDGKKVDFGNDQEPVLAASNRTLVPMRKLFEILGAQIEWNDETSTVKAVKDGHIIVLTIGETAATINDTSVTLDQPAELINDRTMIPVRFVAEALETKVNWLEDTKRVIISTFEREEKKSIKVLAIGNSFTNDAVEYLPNIAAADQYPITVGELTYSASHLSQHWEYANTNAKVYTYAVNNQQVEEKVTMQEVLESEDWDYITLQQVSTNSYKEETFSPYIENLVKYLKKVEPQATILLHQTWSFEKGSGRFKDGLNYQTMFEAIETTYHNISAKLSVLSLDDGTKISEDGKLLRIIPSGLAFQNARRNPVFDTLSGDTKTTKLNRDGAHASYTYGRYLIGALWYECLTGNQISVNTFCPNGITQDEWMILKKAAHEACVQYGWQ